MTKPLEQVFTVDLALSQIVTKETQPRTFSWTTGSKIDVNPITAEGKEVPLDIKGKRYAVKKAKNSYLGNELKYKENSFTPELFALINGGTVTFEEDGTTFKSYDPPAIGDEEERVKFDLTTFSTNYNEAGDIVGYTKITYYYCQGTISGYSQEDDSFFAPEFVITSTPPRGAKPYKIEVVKALPSSVMMTREGDLLATRAVPEMKAAKASK